jgi:hypothetical protein
MKKTLIILSVLVIALTFGTAYAKDMSAGEYNAITVFDKVLPASHDLGSGLALGNGITAFDIRPVAWAVEGKAAGGLRSTEPSMKYENGITVF